MKGYTQLAEVTRMVQMEHLDIRAVTMGINLLPCAGGSSPDVAGKVKSRILEKLGSS